jgi:hypothetical protein
MGTEFRRMFLATPTGQIFARRAGEVFAIDAKVDFWRHIRD